MPVSEKVWFLSIVILYWHFFIALISFIAVIFNLRIKIKDKLSHYTH